jgi:hypothetical protein
VRRTPVEVVVEGAVVVVGGVVVLVEVVLVDVVLVDEVLVDVVLVDVVLVDVVLVDVVLVEVGPREVEDEEGAPEAPAAGPLGATEVEVVCRVVTSGRAAGPAGERTAAVWQAVSAPAPTSSTTTGARRREPADLRPRTTAR